jgi:hypothetical protein
METKLQRWERHSEWPLAVRALGKELQARENSDDHA